MNPWITCFKSSESQCKSVEASEHIRQQFRQEHTDQKNSKQERKNTDANQENMSHFQLDRRAKSCRKPTLKLFIQKFHFFCAFTLSLHNLYKQPEFYGAEVPIVAFPCTKTGPGSAFPRHKHEDKWISGIGSIWLPMHRASACAGEGQAENITKSITTRIYGKQEYCFNCRL